MKDNSNTFYWSLTTYWYLIIAMITEKVILD